MSILLLAIVPLMSIYLFFPKPSKKLQNQYEAIVILGYPANDDGTISNRLKERLDFALMLYEKQMAPIIIVSGASVKNKYKEAEVMKQYLLKAHSTLSILMEEHAHNTFQNFKFIKELTHYTNLLVITSPSHIRRASFFAHKFYHQADVISCKPFDSIGYYIFEYTRLWVCLYYEWKLK